MKVLLCCWPRQELACVRATEVCTRCAAAMLWHALEAVRRSTEKPWSWWSWRDQSGSTRRYRECVLQEPQLGTAHAAMQPSGAQSRSDL